MQPRKLALKVLRKLNDGTNRQCVEWERLAQVTQHPNLPVSRRVIDAGDFPLDSIDDVVKRTRPVGLGIMGFWFVSEARITYGGAGWNPRLDGQDGFVRHEAQASLKIGAEKGVFPNSEANREAYAKFILRRNRHLARRTR